MKYLLVLTGVVLILAALTFVFAPTGSELEHDAGTFCVGIALLTGLEFVSDGWHWWKEDRGA